ncbi:MAG: DUF2785 domain-containing protein [Kofleriaceae bacterium]
MKSPALQRALYYSGALDAYHRRRNRARLTVVMFHRVLAPTDPRWATADPEYSLRDDLFAACLDFFKRHYRVVTVDDVWAARAGGPPLPPRPLLITFDDGWSDNEEFALGHLRRAGLPAVMFVVADVVGRHQPFFQEQLVGAWRAGRLDASGAAALWLAAGGEAAATPRFGGRDDLEPLRAVIARLEALAPAARAAALADVAGLLDDGVRYMTTADQLRNLAGHFVTIGAHGKTHTPLTKAPDLAAELAGARAALAGHVGAAPTTLSCPHGAHDARVITAAHDAGSRLVCTSVPELPAAPAPAPPSWAESASPATPSPTSTAGSPPSGWRCTCSASPTRRQPDGEARPRGRGGGGGRGHRGVSAADPIAPAGAPTATAGPGPAAPPAAGVTAERRAWWETIRAGGPVPPDAPVVALVAELAGFLRSPDPTLRDRLGYEVLAAWLLAPGRLDATTVAALRDSLTAQTAAAIVEGDAVFGRSFAALVLSVIAAREVATPQWTPAELAAQVAAAVAYAGRERDLRGYTGATGWAHAAAHTADWMKFLARHPALTAAEARALLDGVAALAGRDHGVRFSHGEDERLAAAVRAVVRRGLISDADLDTWLAALSAPLAAGWPEPFELRVYARQRNIRDLLVSCVAALWLDDSPGGAAALARLRALFAR